MSLSILNVPISNPCHTVLSFDFHLRLIHLLMVSLEGLSHLIICFGFWFEDTSERDGVCVFSPPAELISLCQVVLWWLLSATHRPVVYKSY